MEKEQIPQSIMFHDKQEQGEHPPGMPLLPYTASRQAHPAKDDGDTATSQKEFGATEFHHGGCKSASPAFPPKRQIQPIKKPLQCTRLGLTSSSGTLGSCC